MGGEIERLADDVVATIARRGEVHGDFARKAMVAEQIKSAMRWGAAGRWDDLPAEQRNALDNIAEKLARAACGAANGDDARDIAGYALLWAAAGEANQQGG